MKKVLINIPHSSTKLTNEFLDRMSISHKELQEQLNILTDYYTDELFENKKCFNLVCGHSRLICDVERFKNDDEEIMSKIGMGAIYTKTTDGKDLIKIDEAYKNNLLETIYDDYHKTLDALTEKSIKENGECVIIDGHSFSETWADVIGNRGPYPDICIGYDEEFCDLNLVEKFKNLANKYGFNCMENYPFTGAIIPNKFYKTKDTRVKGIMIEVNKKVYMDEATGKKTEGYYKVKKLMEEFVGEISKTERKVDIVKVEAENREAFVKGFEEKGFKLDKTFSREEIINSFLPIAIDYDSKTIGRMGNLTCAAAAASQGRLKSEESFGGIVLCENEDVGYNNHK